MSSIEFQAGGFHTVFPMDDSSRVGEARRHAAALADEIALDEVEAGRLALIVTELGTNLLRHANQGRLLLAAQPHSQQVEVIAIDRGPGIDDVALCMGDGFSTGGTSGTGLGAVKRLADSFDMHSAVPDGTIIVARVRRASAADARRSHGVIGGGIAIPAPGESVCGDAWAIGFNGTRAAVMVADGLGHGPDAAKASAAAITVFEADPLGDPRTLLQHAHADLRTTRGAAVSILSLDIDAQSVRSSGAGNISTRVLSGTSDRTVLPQHGTVGVQIRKPEEVVVPWPDHAIVVLHSDGIETRWQAERLAPVLMHDPTTAAAVLLRDHCRGRDDATVVVLKRR